MAATLTRIINGQLVMICAFCTVLVLGILLYRICQIICKTLLVGIVFVPMMRAEELAETPLRKYAQRGLVGSAVRFIVLIVISVLQLLATAVNIALSLVYGLLPLVGLALLFVLMHEKWSESMLVLVDLMNGQVGATLHQLIIAPLVVLDTVGSYVLPVFNLTIYVLVQIPLQLLLWLLKGQGFNHLLDALISLRLAAGDLMGSTKAFVTSNTQGCSSVDSILQMQLACGNITGCSPQTMGLDAAQLADICMNTAGRELDFMPAFQRIQESTGDVILFVADSCSFLGVLANVTLFPLSDPETWLAVDRLLNSLLYAVVVGPSTTISRCELAGGIQTRPSMCTPDFGPSFDLFAEFGMHVGNVLTNWMDAAYLFLFKQTNLESVCASTSQLNSILWSDPVVQRLFGANQTVMIKMDTDAFAVSDGNSVVFMKNMGGQIRKTYAPNLWPSPINPAFGIARTILPSGVNVQDNGLGLLGCRCADVGGAVDMQCSIITQDGTAWDMPMRWSLESETQLLTCDRLRISVQSIRWPHKRVVVNALNINGQAEQECSDGTCLAADVAIYAIPICGSSNGFKAMACLPEERFTRGICFPYCMALRLVHEGFRPITMRGASEWQDGVLMAMRSCVPTASDTTTSTGGGGLVQTTCSITNDANQGTTGAAVADTISADSCRYAYTCSSMVLNKSAVSGYGAGSEFPTYFNYAPSWDGSHLLLNGQPLAVGGDVFMRMFVGADGQNYVDFPTLTGNQVNEFTVEANSPVGIPVTPPADVPKHNQAAEKPGEVFEPNGYVQSAIPYNPSVLTSTSLWYASNPSYEWASSLAAYCASEGYYAQTEIMVLSSYAPARIWRVLYHDRENCYIAFNSRTGKEEHVCRPDIALATSLENQIDVLTSDSVRGTTRLYDMCTTEFNLWIESMEFYKDVNGRGGEQIAVGVRRGTLSDLGKMLFHNTAGKTVFYFLNASNISQPAQEGDPLSAPPHSKYSLNVCPAFKVLPDVGAILGHGIAAVASLFKMPVNLILNPFAMLELLESRGKNTCPENSLGHSVLTNCGMTLLSLDTFFEEVRE